MIRNNNLGALMGAPVLGKDDERIGTVGQVFIDPVTDEPNWMTVHTGLFGRRETFVPLRDAEWDHERLRVDIDKETIKAAPRIDTDEALSPEDEENLYRYYAVQAAGGAEEHDDTDADRADRPGRLKRYVVAEPAADVDGTGDDSASDTVAEGDRHSPRHLKTD
jgi:hypothetical protein